MATPERTQAKQAEAIHPVERSEEMTGEERLTPETVRARMANPPQRAPIYPEDGGHPIDPQLKHDAMNELENILFNFTTSTPKLASERQVQQMLAAMTGGEYLPVAEGEPWEQTVAKAVRSYDFYFQSAPDRASLDFETPPNDLNEYDARWNARTRKLSAFDADTLPQTHDDTGQFGELLPPWNPGDELDALVVVSTSRPGHRWLLRGTTTIETVKDIVRDDQHCDMAFGCCTARAKPSAFNIHPFNHGDLTVIAHVCRECWQQWVDGHTPEPPDEVIYETDVE